MRMFRLITIILAAITVSAVPVAGQPVAGQSIDEAMPSIVEQMVNQLTKNDSHKVGAIDFTDIQGRPNELGRYIAEQLSVHMVTAEGVTVVDRANLDAIMEEHELTAEGLVNPEDAKKLGQVSGLDAILLGRLTALDGSVVLTAKAISTETAEIVAAAQGRFDMTEDTQRMMGLRVGRAGADNSRPRTQVSVSEEGAITVREIGPLTVSMRDVSHQTIDYNGITIPAIQATFELENRRLDRNAAVAVNAIVNTRKEGIVQTEAVRCTLSDCNLKQWIVPMQGLSGVPSVYCFEITESRHDDEFSQNNPAAVADYIHRANRYDFKDYSRDTKGKYWAGSFASLAPGDSRRLTARFIPMSYMYGTDKSISRPDCFGLDLELVVGSFPEGEKPESATDLAVRSLTIDEVALPSGEDDE